uniref:VWFA domain-containing protein n=1 Tax=Panagrellus redivivus TaxID=6233 RepID=A0A7E4W6N5_PANRE
MVSKALLSFDAVLYLDTSIVLRPSIQGDSLKQIFNSVFEEFATTGFRTFHKAFHTNFPVTHKNMYTFFNVTTDNMKATKQIQSGTYVVANSPNGRNVIDSLARCAIEPDCMAPPGAQVKCNMSLISSNNDIGCHRFDQSAMNMRLIELYGINDTNYFLPSDMVSIQRFEMTQNKAAYRRQCNVFLRS